MRGWSSCHGPPRKGVQAMCLRDFCPVPALAHSRLQFMTDLSESAALLALHANTALPLANSTPISECSAFFGTKAFKEFCKEREAHGKNITVLFERINGVIASIRTLGKLLGQALKSRRL